jgi:hypothetical protein
MIYWLLIHVLTFFLDLVFTIGVANIGSGNYPPASIGADSTA